MEGENARLVRELWDAATDDPVHLDLSLLDPEILYEDDLLPDHAEETYRGHEGIRRAWARAIEPWEAEIDVEWTRDEGDVVVSSHRVRGRGRGSGIEVDFRYAYLWRFEKGKVVYLKSFSDPAAALAAAGLEK